MFFISTGYRFYDFLSSFIIFYEVFIIFYESPFQRIFDRP